MPKKTISEQMDEVLDLSKELRRLKKIVIAPNKIWVEGLGIVTLWETKHD